MPVRVSRLAGRLVLRGVRSLERFAFIFDDDTFMDLLFVREVTFSVAAVGSVQIHVGFDFLEFLFDYFHLLEYFGLDCCVLEFLELFLDGFDFVGESLGLGALRGKVGGGVGWGFGLGSHLTVRLNKIFLHTEVIIIWEGKLLLIKR